MVRVLSEHYSSKKESKIKGGVRCRRNRLISPVAAMKYSCLAKPYYYPGSPTPRWSLTVLFDPSKPEDAALLKIFETIAEEEKISTIGFMEGDLISIKFQTKDKIPLFILDKKTMEVEPVELERDVPPGFAVSVEFDINIFDNKKTNENGFNFCPTAITFHDYDEKIQELKEIKKLEKLENKQSLYTAKDPEPKIIAKPNVIEKKPKKKTPKTVKKSAVPEAPVPEKPEKNMEIADVGDNSSRGHRSESPSNGVRSPKLRSGKKSDLAVELRSDKNSCKT